jgi:DNA repair protein RecO (recombination protein O)
MIFREPGTMYRSIATDAVVIRRERMGEFHKSLTLLTSGLGLVTATAFGAYKSKSLLRMGSEPFTHSRASLYHDPVRGTYKVTELEVRESFERMRQDFDGVCAASLWAEVVQRSFGAGETSDALFRLFLGCLRVLDSPGAPPAAYATLQFLWRFLSLAGYVPDPAACDRCGRPLEAEPRAFFEPPAGVFLCPSCARPSSLPLPAGARRYLAACDLLSLKEAAGVRLERESLAALQEFLFSAVQSVLEGELKTLRFQGAPR